MWSLEDGEFRELAAMTSDPVCGRAVETTSGLHREHDGRTWWFCSAHCRDEYIDSPERFSAPASVA